MKKILTTHISITAAALLLAGQLSAAKDPFDSRLSGKGADSNTSSTAKFGDSTLTADTSGFNLQKKSGDTIQNISVSPSQTGVENGLKCQNKTV